jgi:hypothetical protein
VLVHPPRGGSGHTIPPRSTERARSRAGARRLWWPWDRRGAGLEQHQDYVAEAGPGRGFRSPAGARRRRAGGGASNSSFAPSPESGPHRSGTLGEMKRSPERPPTRETRTIAVERHTHRFGGRRPTAGRTPRIPRRQRRPADDRDRRVAAVDGENQPRLAGKRAEHELSLSGYPPALGGAGGRERATQGCDVSPRSGGRAL